MNSFKNKIFEFMQGRYGTDKLTVALLIVYAAAGFLRIVIRNRVADYIILVLMTGLLVFAVFRVLSKNIPKRQAENMAFIGFIGRISPRFILMKDRIKDIKTKRYRRCPECKNVLRLPVKRGKHNVKCPKCGSNFSVHIL